MDVTTYQKLASKTYGGKNIYNCDELHIAHMTMGIMTETIELRDGFFSNMGHTNFIEECGDLMWYTVMLADFIKKSDGIMDTIIDEIVEEDKEVFNYTFKFKIGSLLDDLLTIAGELLDCTKKNVAYKKEYDKVRLLQLVEAVWEIVVTLIVIVDGDPRECMKVNIHKLTVRYPDKFTVDRANNRNTEDEWKIMEKYLNDTSE